jgi:hypothetical protein
MNTTSNEGKSTVSMAGMQAEVATACTGCNRLRPTRNHVQVASALFRSILTLAWRVDVLRCGWSSFYNQLDTFSYRLSVLRFDLAVAKRLPKGRQR